jgi:general secretion pathway protein K
LVVVTVVVLLASTLNSDFVVTFKRVENQLHSQQAYAFMRGAEGIAREVLLTDFNNDKAGIAKDHRSEGFNQRIEYPMPQGVIAGTLCDLQGRFNLNNLAGTAVGAEQYTADQQVFIRLLQVLELGTPLDQRQAEEVTLAVADWIDADNNVRGLGGAEDTYYSNLDLPYKTGNQELQSVSELMWVKGITAELYSALLPHIAALPTGVPLNVNGAGYYLLRAINEKGVLQPLSESEADGLLSDRDGDIDGSPLGWKDGFDELADFVASHPSAMLDTSSFSIGSEYFLLQTETFFLDRLYTLYSVMNRGLGGTIKTIARSKSGIADCPVEKSNN